ncbi:hypothetical protein B296_00055258, partial [Ensete ventricosum]
MVRETIPYSILSSARYGYRYVDRSLPGDTAKIDRQRSLVGEKGKKKKRKRRKKKTRRRRIPRVVLARMPSSPAGRPHVVAAR